CLATPALAQTKIIDVAAGEAERHEIGGVVAPLVVRTPWRQTENLDEQTRSERFQMVVVVDESGAVDDAVIVAGPTTQRDEARAKVMALRFHPFLAERGAPVRARFNYDVLGLPADYSGPADRTIPADVDLSNVLIRLNRGACYGACPVYELEI